MLLTCWHNLPLSTVPHPPRANHSDADGDKLAAAIVSQPSHGSVTLNSDGSFTYTPDADYSGSDSFSYTVSDGMLTTTASVSLTINSRDDNTTPTAGPATYNVVHDQTLSVSAEGLLAYASDSDGDFLTVSLASGASDGTASVNSDGSFTYTPDAGWTGTDSFTYTASDGQSTSNAATVTIHVTDQSPVAVDDSYSVERNNDLYADVLDNDSDADGANLTTALVSGPSNGTLSFNSDGSFEGKRRRDSYL